MFVQMACHTTMDWKNGIPQGCTARQNVTLIAEMGCLTGKPTEWPAVHTSGGYCINAYTTSSVEGWINHILYRNLKMKFYDFPQQI